MSMELNDSLPIRLVLLDNDDVARSRSVARLEQPPELEIVGDAADSTDALRLTRELQPDAVLVESHLQDKRGLEAIALLSSIDEAERPAVVAYLEILHRGTWPQARAAGADDLLLKEMPTQSIARELRSIVNHVRSDAL
ncbi:MAG: response regulator [Chloroflexota bacterium]|nr:response regulator [Chloroflexota bacterium]